MSKSLILDVKNISKAFILCDKSSDILKQVLANKIRNIFRNEDVKSSNQFEALKNISFEVYKGETFGIIGKNGSGKSTLLQIVSGIITPSEGTYSVNGRVAALLELGSCFNEEFTGIENIKLNAKIFGFTDDEIDNKMETIINYADIGEFIYQPVKTYSSGMALRLAFAVQAQLEPDLFIIDEAISVGDAKFQNKCFETIKELKKKGTTILLVSHSPEQIIDNCDRALLIDHGQLISIGDTQSVINKYFEILYPKGYVNDIESGDENKTEIENVECNLNIEEFSSRKTYNEHEQRFGDQSATIIDHFLRSKNTNNEITFDTGEIIYLDFFVKVNRNIENPIIGILFRQKNGSLLYSTNSKINEGFNIPLIFNEGEILQVKFSFKCTFLPGDYFISLGIASDNSGEIIAHDRRYNSIYFSVNSEIKELGIVDLDPNIGFITNRGG